MKETANILAAHNLSLSYKQGDKTNVIFKDFSFNIAKNKVIGLAGPSGCGKSSIAKMILGLIDSKSAIINGQILFTQGTKSIDLNAPYIAWSAIRGRKISMIFQESGIHLNPIKKCGTQLEDRLKNSHSKNTKHNALTLFSKMGLEDPEAIYNAYPHEISGGQAQRVQIAFALSTQPDLLICDEITSSLDPQTKKGILQLLTSLKMELGLSILFISHDQEAIYAVCDDFYTLSTEANQGPTIKPKTSSKNENVNLLTAQNLHFGYDGTTILKGVTQAFASNKIYGIKGRSGEGKSTLAKVLSNIYRPTEGAINLKMKDLEPNVLNRINTDVIYLYQDAHQSLNPKIKVITQLKEIYLINNVSVTNFDDFIHEICDDLNLEYDSLQKRPRFFSGGQKQRINLARALCAQPLFLICDEVFSALDPETKSALQNRLIKSNRVEQIGIIIISHDEAVLKTICDVVLTMEDGLLK